MADLFFPAIAAVDCVHSQLTHHPIPGNLRAQLLESREGFTDRQQINLTHSANDPDSAAPFWDPDSKMSLGNVTWAPVASQSQNLFRNTCEKPRMGCEFDFAIGVRRDQSRSV